MDKLPEHKSWGVEGWVTILEENQRFQKADNYIPKPGDYVFFVDEQILKDSGKRTAGHVGIVYTVDEETGLITVIEGNSKDMVQVTGPMDYKAEKIFGYGVMPENPDLKQEEEQKQETVSSEENAEEPVQTDEVTIATDTFNAMAAGPFADRMLMMKAPMRGDGEGNGEGGSEGGHYPYYDEIATEADRLYNPSTGVGSTILVSITGGPTEEERNHVKAGDILEYRIGYEFVEPMPWYTGYSQPMTLFDAYENSTIKVHLPAGLSITGQPEKVGWDYFETVNNNDGTTDYIFHFNDMVAAEAGFTFNVLVGNNGTNESLNTYTLGGESLTPMVTFDTYFQILDKWKTPYEEVGEPYHHTKTAYPEISSFKTETTDRWGVEKEAVGTPSFNTAKTEVTFTWLIKVGFYTIEQVDDGTGNLVDVHKVISNIETYKLNGRDGLTSFTLTDVVSAVCTNGVPVGDPISIKINKGTTSSTDAVDLVGLTQPIIVWGEGANTKLKLTTTSVNSGGVANDPAPAYTSYYVQTTYQIEPEMVAAFSDNTFYSLTATNTASTSALLAKQTTAQNDSDHAVKGVDLPITEPATIKIFKDLVNSQGNGSPYTDKYSAIDYVLTRTNTNDTEFTVYYIDTEDNNKYKPIPGMQDVTSATLSGNTLYYIPAGDYKVVESLTPEQEEKMVFVSVSDNGVKTLTPGFGWEPLFTNQEQLGLLTVTKVDIDNNNKKLSGAKFELRKKGGNEELMTPEMESTNANGIMLWKDLPYGTYVLTEIQSAPGYSIIDTAENPKTREITISAENQHEEITYKNQSTKTKITLEKYVASTGDYALTTSTTAFANAFTLRRTTKDPSDPTFNPATDWSPVTKDYDNNTITISLSGGKWSANVEATTGDGTPYYYQFVETIPSGYYNPSDGNSSTATSDALKLVDGSGDIVSDTTFKMYNRQYLRFQIDKNNYDWTASGEIKVNYNPVTFKLYYYTGEMPDNPTAQQLEAMLIPVEEQTTGVIGNNRNRAIFANVYPYNIGDGAKRHYVIEELNAQNYKLNISAQTYGTVKTWAGRQFIVPDVSLSRASFTYTAQNYTRLVQVLIYKTNYYDQSNSNITGTGFTIRDENGNVVSGLDSNFQTITVSNQPIPYEGHPANTVYGLVYLEVGQKYTFEEAYNNSILPRPAPGAAHYSDNGIIDLSDVTPSTTSTKTITRNIYNIPNPKVTISKKDSVTGESINGARFRVYKNTGTEDAPVYEVVRQNGSEIIITSGSTTEIRLEPNITYYFEEIAPYPEGYLAPNDYWDEYNKLNTDPDHPVCVRDESNGRTLFVATVVDGPTANKTDNEFSFSVKNIPNKGILEVLKTVDGKSTSQTFTITATVGNTTYTVDTVSTNRGAIATFDNDNALPVYDENGQKIRYTISESLSPKQALDYYKSTADQYAELVVRTDSNDTTITNTDISGQRLVVNNVTKISVQTSKYYRRPWEYAFIGMQYPMSGATIGLYKKVGNNWILVPTNELPSGTLNPQSTSTDDASVAFGGLRRDTDYALVELASGNPNMFPYDPSTGTFYPAPYYPQDIQSIPDTAIGNYNVRYLRTSTTSTSANKKFILDDMVNANHWVQFHITKWLDADVAPAGQPIINGTAVNKEQDSVHDNAVFELFRYVVPENAAEDTAIPYPGNGWEYVGSYTSGTMYNLAGVRQIGEFMTALEQNITDRYVYLLVETYPGPGAVINPNFQYSYYVENHHQYTVTLTNVDSDVHIRPNKYTIDTVNNDDILNSRPSGTGPGEYYFASIRLSKWKDTIDKTTGKPNKNYEPLPNATFKLYLEDGRLLTTLTTGLDADPQHPDQTNYAVAQSGTFELLENTVQYNDDGVSGTVTIRDLQNIGLTDSENNDLSIITKVPFEKFTFTYEGRNFTGYRIKTKLYETSAPEGFGYIETAYSMYLCFVDITSEGGENWVFNDAYLVTNETNPKLAEDQQGTSWFVRSVREATTFSDGSYRFAVAVGDGQTPLRIVDYPIENTMVHVRKFGYKPNSGTGESRTVGKTSAELDLMSTSSIDRVAMDGVTMIIEHKNESTGAWEKWDYKKNKPVDYENGGTDEDATFETNEEGGFVFPDGLKIGEYRIYETETSLPTKWAAYEIAYNGPDYARVFKVVDKAAVDVTMYNPLKISITLIKQDWNGTNLFDEIPNGTFKLGTISATRDEENKIFIFRNLASGTYALTETFTGYSSQYLKQFLDIQYGLGDIVDGTFIGYDYQVKTVSEGNEDVVISAITPVNSDHNVNVNKASITLTIKNPKEGSVTLNKQGETENETNLSAQFVGYRRLFDLEAEQTLDLSGIESINAHGELKTTYGFERMESLDGSTSYTKDKLAPGIYAFIETVAPDDYDVLKTWNNKPVVYYVIITGGMNIQINGATVTGTPDYAVTGLPTSARLWDNSTVKTLYSDKESEAITITAKDYKTVTLDVSKIVWAGSYGEDCPDNWEFEFRLYDGTGNNKKQVGIIKLNRSNPSGTFKTTLTGNTYSQLTKGKTYYLEEIEKNHFSLYTVTLSTSPNTPIAEDIESGLYPITITGENLIVTVKNKWLYGKVEFWKVDKDNHESKLSGAQFVVQYDPDGNGEYETITDAIVKETPAGSGYYIATIPLVSENQTTYRILETAPPPGFLLVDETYLDVELSFEKNHVTKGVSGEDLYIENTKGDQIVIQKYNNVHTSEVYLHQAGPEEAEFTLYHEKSDGTWETIEPLSTTQDTVDPETGVVTPLYTVYTFVTVPHEHYAVVESWANPDLYLDLEGFFTESGVELTDTVEVRDGVEAIDLGVNTSILLKAYNIPKIVPRIVKKDVGGYPTGVVAAMTFYIFEVPNNFEDSDESVEQYLENHPLTEAIFTGDTSTPYGTSGTYKDWEPDDQESSKYWNPKKTYLLVETKVMPNSSGSTTHGYNTMRKDDIDVTWYYVIRPVEDPITTANYKYEFILENAYGDADVTIEKTAAPDTIESLLSANRDITYTITPTVTSNNQMLSTFVVHENGLIAKCVNEENPSSSELRTVRTPWTYQFTSITIGKVTSHTIPQSYIDEYNLSGDDLLVSAIVTFLDSNNQPVGNPITVNDLTSSDRTISVPEESKTATQFTVEYFCAGIRKIPNIPVTYFDEDPQLAHTYSLGKDFKVDPITVNVTVLKNGSLVEVTDEILEIDNTAVVDWSYPKWSQDGSEVTMIGGSPDDSAVVNVKSLIRPTVSLQKTVNLTNAKPNDLATYTITVTNTSTVDFEKPVLIDILPTGVHFEEFKSVTGDEGTQIGDPSIRPVKGEPSQSINENEEGIVADSETAVIFAFDGIIRAGETITIEFTARISKTVTMYGESGHKEIENDVYLTSAKTTYRTNTNKQGFSFISDNISLTEAAQRLDGDNPEKTASLHLNGSGNEGQHGMNPALTELGYLGEDASQYAWIAGKSVIPVVAQDSISIRKAVRGDKDTGFSDEDDFLGSATRTKEVTGAVGWVRWRLSIMNGNEEATNFAVGDAIPRDNDERHTEWDVIMDKFLVVEQDGTSINSGMYTIYYYTGEEDTAADAVEEALKNCRTEGWLEAHNWSLGNDTNFPTLEEKASVTAFLMVFAPAFKLAKNVSITIVYETAVPIVTDAEFASIGFTNANNTFSIIRTTASVTNKLTSSNIVSVTLLDDDVEVQGDLWIDEDLDGTQQSANRRDYQQYAIIQELANATTFTIKDERKVPGTPPTRYIESMFSTSSEDQELLFYTNGKPNTSTVEYESIVHFRFTKLGPAKEKDETVPPYDSTNTLNIDALKTTDPYNYTLGATINLENFSEVFKMTPTGDGNYMSDDPDSTATQVINNKKDNNFREKAEGSFDTKPFYIRYSRNVDQSKDLGVQIFRSLEITKVAQDELTTVLPGAKFQFFGPYDDEYSTEQNKVLAPSDTTSLDETSPYLLHFSKAYDENNVFIGYQVDPQGDFTELETDENGKLVVLGLNWWKQYVVKEVGVPEGYSNEGATMTVLDTPPATAENGKWHDEKHQVYKEVEALNNGKAFLLKIPAIERTSQESVIHVRVEDPRYVEVQLDVEKILETLSEESFTFNFNLRLIQVEATDPTSTARLAELNAALMPTPVLDEDKNPVKFDGTNFDPATMLYYYGLDDQGDPKLYLNEDGTPNNDAINTEALYLDNIIRTLTISLSGNATDGIGRKTESFPNPIKLNGPGTYTFHIEEIAPNPLPDGWTYDPHHIKTATVVVEWKEPDPDDPNDDTEPGLYVTSIAYSDFVANDDVEGDDEHPREQFTNEYVASGEWAPEAIKDLVGRELTSFDNFTFKVYENNINGDEVAESTGLDPATGKITFTAIQFPDLTYVGEHTYVIAEERGSDTTIGYTDSLITIKLTVEDVGGELVATKITYSPDNKTFINTFSASGDWAPVVKKKLTGIGMDEFEEFKTPKTFKVTVTDITKQDDPKVVMSGETTVTNSKQLESFVFTPGQVDYTQATVGQYTYLIEEVITGYDGVGGITCDRRQYTVVVDVSLHQNQDGTYSKDLDVVPSAPSNTPTGTLEDPIVFENTYDASGEAVFKARKILKSGETVLPIGTEQFEFQLKDKNGNVLQTKYADPTTKIVTFDAIAYELKDDGVTYEYTIVEVDTDGHNMVYDPHEVLVRVTPVDNGDGTMTCTPVYYEKNEQGDWVMLNTTDANDVVQPIPEEEVPAFYNEQLYSLKIKKFLDDPDAASSDKRFNFTIKLWTLENNNEVPYTGIEVGNVIEKLNVILYGVNENDLKWEETSEGTYTFTLAHNEEIELKLPDGVQYKIEEAGAGYTVTVFRTMNGGTPEEVTQVDKYTILGGITVSDGDQEVVYKNQPGVNLPLTGGSGTVPFTAAGLCVLGSGLCYAMYLRKKKEREDDLKGSEDF